MSSGSGLASLSALQNGVHVGFVFQRHRHLRGGAFEITAIISALHYYAIYELHYALPGPGNFAGPISQPRRLQAQNPRANVPVPTVAIKLLHKDKFRSLFCRSAFRCTWE